MPSQVPTTAASSSPVLMALLCPFSAPLDVFDLHSCPLLVTLCMHVVSMHAVQNGARHPPRRVFMSFSRLLSVSSLKIGSSNVVVTDPQFAVTDRWQVCRQLQHGRRPRRQAARRSLEPARLMITAMSGGSTCTAGQHHPRSQLSGKKPRKFRLVEAGAMASAF